MSATSQRNTKAIVALCVTAAAVLVLAAFWVRSRTEPASRAGLAQARARWQQSGISSYDMDLEMTGTQTGLYHIEIRDGAVTRMTRNGQPANPSAAEYWTVDGWFTVIEEELDKAELSQRSAVADVCQTWVRVRYDPERGYPSRLIRQETQPSRRTPTGMETSGASMSVDVRVLKFDPR